MLAALLPWLSLGIEGHDNQTRCPGKTVVRGYCLADAPFAPGTDPKPPAGGWDESSCCSACVARQGCVAWNINRAQRACHLRAGVGNPNASPQCSYGVARPLPPPPPPPTPAPPGAKNVLIIVNDDLRPFYAPFTERYGVRAPNLRKLAESSVVFQNAYVQQAVCGPSRNSFMTGRRPDSTNVWTFQNSFRRSGIDTSGKAGSEWGTFPGLFKRHGYNVLGMGKLYHPGSPRANDCPDPHPAGSHAEERCPSWSTRFTTPQPQNIVPLGYDSPGAITNCTGDTCKFTYYQPDSQIFLGAARGSKPPVPCAGLNTWNPQWQPDVCDLEDAQCTDLWLADAAVKALTTVSADKTKPWALFVGFHKPHPFWDVPQRFQDEYLQALPLPNHTDAPSDLPDVAYYSCTSINTRSEIGGPLCNDTKLNPDGCSYIVPNASYAASKGIARPTEAAVRKIRAGYAGGVTWVDEQIGKVLGALDGLGLNQSTLVMHWADHGWALGEQAMFCKMANFELQTRVPLMIRAPWLQAAGSRSDAMVELVDMLPTALELAGLGPDAAAEEALEGTSLAPLVAEPGLHRRRPDLWKNAAFSQYPRCMNSTMAKTPPFLAAEDPCVGHTANQITHMGYSMRTAEWRYAEWPKWVCYGLDGDPDRCSDLGKTMGSWSGSANWDELGGVELYDHRGDTGDCFDCYENENLANRPENRELVKRLSAQLRAGWRKAE